MVPKGAPAGLLIVLCPPVPTFLMPPPTHSKFPRLSKPSHKLLPQTEHPILCSRPGQPDSVCRPLYEGQARRETPLDSRRVLCCVTAASKSATPRSSALHPTGSDMRLTHRCLAQGHSKGVGATTDLKRGGPLSRRGRWPNDRVGERVKDGAGALHRPLKPPSPARTRGSGPEDPGIVRTNTQGFSRLTTTHGGGNCASPPPRPLPPTANQVGTRLLCVHPFRRPGARARGVELQLP